MKVIVYGRPQGALDEHDKGGISLLHGVDMSGTDEDILAAHSKSIPEWAQDVRVVDESELPADRHFRNAWKCEGGAITTCIDSARDITKDRLRRERSPLLAELDVQFMRALEAGQETAPIVAEKQRLRDITKQVDLESDLEALKVISCHSA